MQEVDYRKIIGMLSKKYGNDRNRVLNAVYDVDDVLNNLVKHVCKTLKVSLPDRFEINLCKNYSEDEKKEVYRMFEDPETFRHVEYDPDANKICEVEKTGKVLVWINSNNLNQSIVDVKVPSLLENISDLTPERIRMEIRGRVDCNFKEALENTDIVVEDNLLHLLNNDECVKILINRTHNQADVYNIKDADYNIIRVNELSEAIDIINRIAELW